MGYRFSERAILDTEALYEASLIQFGQRAADRYFDIMLNAAQFAADHPLASPERTEISIPLRVRYFGAHLLVYQLIEDEVVIMRVFHQSQDWLELL
ncbi:MAG: type II toxin-antitoxin system RelE/ParE family toxin [Devosia sp.]|jgi:toxin ParE1/3/4